jgi:hypothetical protein
MTISRENIPQQMFYEEGGAANSTDIGLQELASLIKQKQDFNANKAKYEERLGGMIEPTQPMDIYQAASQLGKGLLETPNTGGASAFTGLAAGFNNIVDEARRREETAKQERQQVAMKAMELALEDERLAEKYLNDYNMKVIDNANKKQSYVTIEYIDNDGNKQTTRKADTNANAAEINELLSKYQGKIVEPIKITQEIGGVTAIDEEIIKNIGKNVAAYNEKAVAAGATVEQVNYARNQATQLGPENFGPTETAFLGMRQLADELGFGELFNIDSTDLGRKTALNQLSMNFTMGIVSQTKGAISNKEMELFIQAAPTLGSTYEGFMEQIRLLEKLATRDLQFNTEYLKELNRLNKEGKNATEISASLAEFELNFQKNFPLFDENDRKIIDDAIANTDALAEGFDIDAYKKEIEDKKKAQAKKGGNDKKSISDFDGAEKDLYEKWLANNPDATDEEKEAARKIVLNVE